jgi:hypothetical protein
LILSTRHSSLVEHFVLHEGITKLLSLLYTTNLLSSDKVKLDIKKQYETLLCLKSIISTEQGMKTFLQDKHGINTVAELLNSGCFQSREISCSILSIIALYSDQGFKLVLSSINHFKLVTREKKRFMFLIDSIEESKDNLDYIAAVLMLINSLLYSSSDIPTRNNLQKEVIELGLLKIIKELKTNETSMLHEKLKTQIKAFEEDILDNYELKYTDLDDPEKIAKLLYVKLSGTESASNFVNILRYFFIAAENKTEQELKENFNLLEMMIKKSLLNEKGMVKEVSLAEIKLNDRIHVQQNQIDNFERKMKEKNQKIKENVSKWTTMKLSESSTVEESIDDSMFKEIYENIISSRKQYEEKFSQQENEILSLQKKINDLKDKSLNPDSLKNSTSSNEDKTPTTTTTSENQEKFKKDSSVMEEIVISLAPPPPPPPPPMGINGIPSAPQALDMPKISWIKPKSSIKQFHCADFSKAKLKKSIFVEKILKDFNTDSYKIDFGVLEDEFTAKKKKLKEKVKEKQTAISLLSPSRSYNVSIILRTLKMKPQKIFDAIMELDDDDEDSGFSEENIDSLINICPTNEELDSLSIFGGDISKLADADQFFLKMKDIPNLSQRLQSWKFKKTFKDIMSNLKPDIEIVNQAIEELKVSESFMKILGIVLSIANFMAKPGQTIYGFKMSSLTKLKDTKTSNNKSNLLKFIVTHIMTKESKEIQHFEDQLNNVSKASRIPFESISKQLSNLKQGIKEISNLIGVYARLVDYENENDELIEKMSKFEVNATYQINEVEEKYEIMKKGLSEISNLYDEPNFINKPEDFFNEISIFMDSFKVTTFELTLQHERKEYFELLESSRNKQKKSVHQGSQQHSVQNKAHSVLDIIAKNMANGNIFKQKKFERDQKEIQE